MESARLRVFPLLFISLCAVAIGMFLAIAALVFPPSSPTTSLRDPGPYIFVGMVGITAVASLGMQERRIHDLEDQIRKGKGA